MATEASMAVRPVEALLVALGLLTIVVCVAVRPVEAVSVALGLLTTVSVVAVRPVEAVSMCDCKSLSASMQRVLASYR